MQVHQTGIGTFCGTVSVQGAKQVAETERQAQAELKQGVTPVFNWGMALYNPEKCSNFEPGSSKNAYL